MDKWLKDVLPDKYPYHNCGRDQIRKKGGVRNSSACARLCSLYNLIFKLYKCCLPLHGVISAHCQIVYTKINVKQKRVRVGPIYIFSIQNIPWYEELKIYKTSDNTTPPDPPIVLGCCLAELHFLARGFMRNGTGLFGLFSAFPD